MITLTTEQAQQIEEALVATLKNNDYWLEKCTGALDTIRAARAHEQAEHEPVAEGYMKCPACNDRGVIRQHFTELERMLIEDAFEKAVKKAAPVQQAEQEPVACPHGVDDGACIECYMEQTDYFDYGLEEVEDYLRNCCNNNFMADKLSDIRKALYSAPVQQAEQEPAPWKHDCAALCMNDVELWIDNCPHCGKPRTAPSEPVKQEPVAWMWACTECGTEAEDGTDCRICSSCGYHKFYKAPKVATCVCAAKTQEQAEQEPVAWMYATERKDFANDKGLMFTKNSALKDVDWMPLYSEPVKSVKQEPVAWMPRAFPVTPDWKSTVNSSETALYCKPLYAAPVRTKDLTDDEIREALYWVEVEAEELVLARAVIAAHKGKNRG